MFTASIDYLNLFTYKSKKIYRVITIIE